MYSILQIYKQTPENYMKVIEAIYSVSKFLCVTWAPAPRFSSRSARRPVAPG